MSETVKKEAQEILDKFAKDLKHAELKPVSLRLNGASFRKEDSGEECDVDFRTIMFKNARLKDKLYLLLEKGSWN